MVAMAGMNASGFLFEMDPFKRALIQAVAQRRTAIAEEERQDLAERIINVLAKSLKLK